MFWIGVIVGAVIALIVAAILVGWMLDGMFRNI
jgi:hypothetical protein